LISRKTALRSRKGDLKGIRRNEGKIVESLGADALDGTTTHRSEIFSVEDLKKLKKISEGGEKRSKAGEDNRGEVGKEREVVFQSCIWICRGVTGPVCAGNQGCQRNASKKGN